jgi:succinate dehydrogenase / fumarate reductase cytochrome b subunit
MSSLILTLRESVRYRGRSGHWSWVAHRISGLAILLFVVIHVWDTANAHFYHELYEWSLALFKHPTFAVGEIGVMAAVLYHAINGVRITILDYRPELWKHQKTSTTISWALFLITFIPIGIFMFSGILEHCSGLAAGGGSCWSVPPLSNYLN